VNKLRSSLTMLGIIIGVAAVITMIGVGTGAQARVEEQIKVLGSNLIMLLPGSVTSGGVRMGAGSRNTLTEDDSYAIQREIQEVQAAAPQLRGTGQVVAGNNNWSTVFYGVTPEHFEVRNWVIASGKGFDAADLAGSAKVALLGETVIRNLFGDGDPLGQVIRIRKVPFVVIGTLGRKGQSLLGQDQDDVILMPISTARNRVLGGNISKQRTVGSVFVKVRDEADMSEVEGQIRSLLRQRHRLQQGQDDDFTLRNLSEVLQAQEQSSRIMTPGGGFGVAARQHRTEHHAGIGDRAHPRNRLEDGCRRARSRYPDAVPGGGGDAGADRGPAGHLPRGGGFLRDRPLRRMADRAQSAGHCACGGFRGRDRHLLRLLPCAKSIPHAADRGAQIRVIQ
jgi:ABC-type antimicrobial peptide transport system permease subunit